MMQEKISVIIPVYNVNGNFLEEAVLSVLQQTYSNIEIIIVDDCSSNPETVQKEENLAGKYSCIRLFRNEINRKVGYSRNFGIDKARGEWISFLDSDDYMLPTYLEKMLLCAKEKQADIVVTGYCEVDEEGKTLALVPPEEEGFDSLAFPKTSGVCWDKLFRKSFLNENHIRFPLNIYLEDSVFLIQCMRFQETNPMAVCRQREYCYRSNARSLTKNKKFHMMRADQLPFDCLEEILRENQHQGNDVLIHMILDLVQYMAFFMSYLGRHHERVIIAQRTGELLRLMKTPAKEIRRIVDEGENRKSGKFINKMTYYSACCHLEVPFILLVQDMMRLAIKPSRSHI